jgi:N-acetyl-anhydromuramyl-L-alanine amidase AmpD
MRTIELIVIHCSATRCDRRFSLEDLIACHNARFGFTGYHWYITKDGTTYQTRHEQLVGAHAKGYNQHAIGICYEGGLTPDGEPADTRTPQQKAALKHLLKDLRKRYPEARILGHRDLPNVSKACPCFDAETEYAAL